MTTNNLKTASHSISQGAGVLLGNLQYQGEDTLLNELNDSKSGGNLNSVYAMRVSHSNLNNNKKPPQPSGLKSNMKTKRKHLQSAVTRSVRPSNLTTMENNTFSH
jgi:hypothetical protein